MCLFEKEKHTPLSQGDTYDQYRRWSGEYPDFCCVRSLDPFVVWRSRVLLITHLKKQGVWASLCERVHFARRRFGRYDVVDFLAVLFGYAISGERTLEEFYERLQPCAAPFMALFERDQLPSRSALSRFLTALTEAPVETLRTLFLDDLLSRLLTHNKQAGGLADQTGHGWVVFDIDGTREAARQRALPQTEDLPPPFRRLDDVCAPGRARVASVGKS